MARAGLSGFIRLVGFEDFRDKVLAREYEPAILLKRMEGRGKPVLFRLENVKNDVAGNVVDTREKLYKALNVDSDEEAYRKLIGSYEGRAAPRTGWAGGYQESSDGWMSLPAIKFYERDGGLYLTAGIVVACWKGTCNASIHRIMVVDRYQARIRIVPRHLWRIYREAVKERGSLPVTVVLGVHPAYLIAAASSPPYGVFELDVGSRLLGGEPLAESPIHGNPIPARAGAVVEAEITGEMGPEGPFADILLLYDEVRMQPTMRALKVYISQEEPVQTVLSGGLEHVMLMGFPREAAIWDTVRRVVPRVHAVRLTPGGGGWLHAVISIEKAHIADGKNAAMAAFTGHPSLKHVVVVDSDINIDDPRMVEWAVATRFQADRDLLVVSNVRGSTLDPSGRSGVVAKMALDATVKGDKERFEMARIPGYEREVR